MTTPPEEFDEEDTFIVEYHTPIETARKDFQVDGSPYNEDDPESISEWATAVAMSEFKIGQEITVGMLLQALKKAKALQILDSLEAKGLIETCWDPDEGDVAYKIKGQ